MSARRFMTTTAVVPPSRGRSLPSPLRLALIAVLTIGSVGCGNQGVGELTGGPLVVESCAARGDLRRFDPFVMPLTFMALERDEDVVLMRFAPDSSLVPVDDGMTMTVDDFSAIRAEIAVAGQTTRNQEQGLRVGLNLGETCPESRAPMVARYAEATFESLAVDGGQNVVFNVVFDLFDERSGQQVGWNLSARGDFVVKLGTPYQLYSDPASQKH